MTGPRVDTGQHSSQTQTEPDRALILHLTLPPQMGITAVSFWPPTSFFSLCVFARSGLFSVLLRPQSTPLTPEARSQRNPSFDWRHFRIPTIPLPPPPLSNPGKIWDYKLIHPRHFTRVVRSTATEYVSGV